MEQIIYKENLKERIDVYLSNKFGYSRNFFHHIIQRGGVLVNDKIVKKSYKLKNNDKIKVDNLERYLDSSFMEELPFVKIPILLEKEDYLVLDKPKGVLSHPNSIWDLSAPSVVAFLYQKYKNLPSIGNFVRAGLVHRLDKETSGLMIVAKTEKGLDYFKKLFNKKSQLIEQLLPELNLENPDFKKLENIENEVGLKKFYRAKTYILEKGKKFLDNIGKTPFYICENVIAKVPYFQPKLGITKIINFEKENNKANLDLQIITGRTHQIRYHLSKNGLPIVGDYLYGKDEKKAMELQAYKLEFVDLEGEKIKIESKL